MGPRPDPFASDETLPARTSVVVIGGGIIGVSTALELAERGIDVVLCEKGGIAGEQSSRNWGWCRQMGRDPREIPLIQEAMKGWRGINQRIEGETGYRECGILYLCQTDSALAEREHWLDEHARPHQLSSRLVSAERAAELSPGSPIKWKGGLYTENDGRAEPQKAAPAIATAARRLGAKIFTGCAVRGIEKQAGRISGVVTEKGRIDCDAVVLAGGAWSRRFCTNAAIELHQLNVVSSVLRTEPIETGLEVSTSGGNFCFRKRLDGGYTVARGGLSVADIVPDSFRLFSHFLPNLRAEWSSLKLRLGKAFIDEARMDRHWALDQVSPFEKVRTLDPEPTQSILNEAVRNLQAAYPVFKEMKIAQTWGGCIDVTPDAVPVISGVEGVPGFFIASGFSGHGFGLGPGAGKLAADLVTGNRPCVDPAPFRHSRMTDGTAVKMMAEG
jgi:glycine/D-amino acid oxidase-like deaminating enzyme